MWVSEVHSQTCGSVGFKVRLESVGVGEKCGLVAYRVRKVVSGVHSETCGSVGTE